MKSARSLHPRARLLCCAHDVGAALCPTAAHKHDEFFVVEDANGVALAYVYFEDQADKAGARPYPAPTPRP